MTETTRPFDHLVFDLDDTLLDTSRLLLPQAARDACAAMIEAGLEATIEDCTRAWAEHRLRDERREAFPCLVQRFGVREGRDSNEVAQSGSQAFYNRKVESTITLFPGVREMLSALRERYGLHLVTSGGRETQEEKIRLLELRGLFIEVHHVDPSRGEFKREAFRRIMTRTAAAPERYLSIGNRIDTDIGQARELGWQGCWVRYGEHARLRPSKPIEEPDFVVEKTVELIETCRL